MKAASQQGAVAACAAPVWSIAWLPGCAGPVLVALRGAGEASKAAGHLRGQRERAAAAGCPRPEGGWAPGPGLPDRGQAGFGSWRGSSLPSGMGAVGVSGASEAGAWRIVAALRGRSVAAVGRRWRSVRSGPVSLKAGGGSADVLGLLVPRRSLIPGRLPGLRGL